MSPFLLNLYVDSMVGNARLAESRAGVKIARRNINSLRYADVTILMVESEEELKRVLMRVKRRVKKLA